jgi:Zn-dependent protease with chaperone function
VTGASVRRLAGRRDRVQPLWDRIDANRLKAGAFLVAFVLCAGLAAALFTGVAGVFVALVVLRGDPMVGFLSALPAVTAGAVVLGAGLAIAHAVRVLAHPERRLPGQFGATCSQKGTFLETKSALHDMATAAGYPHSPQLWVIEECGRVNAFALGLKESRAVVGVTRGFAERLSPDDQRAAFANLMARLTSGDTLWATVISAVMGPIWAARAAQLRSQEAREEGRGELVDLGETSYRAGDSRAAGVAGGFILGFFAVVLTELMMAGHERAAMVAAEKADAEGMLLLKDPRAMLGGLERILEVNNTVPGAGEEYSMLFYCWAGVGYAPEDDPEMERVGRLREVLGAEGYDPAVS